VVDFFNLTLHKYIGYTFDEMFEKIEELDQDYDCILLHVFTNNLRNDTPEQCVEICDEYISALSSHCKFAKIILSLPFLAMTEQMRSMWEFPISKIFARLLSEFCCNCSFKLLSASDSGEKRLDVSMSNSDDSLYPFRLILVQYLKGLNISKRKLRILQILLLPR
jgi:hypothetical protein